MLKRLPDISDRPVTITIDGAAFVARRGDTVAAALMTAGHPASRMHPVTSEPRGPYCLMGVCFECLVTIDGIGNRQSCMIEVGDGMVVETQSARREAGR